MLCSHLHALNFWRLAPYLEILGVQWQFRLGSRTTQWRWVGSQDCFCMEVNGKIEHKLFQKQSSVKESTKQKFTWKTSKKDKEAWSVLILDFATAVCDMFRPERLVRAVCLMGSSWYLYIDWRVVKEENVFCFFFRCLPSCNFAFRQYGTLTVYRKQRGKSALKTV